MASVLRQIRNRFISGILLLVPAAVTLFVMQFLFRWILRWVRPLLQLAAKIDVPEAAVVSGALLLLFLGIYLLGLLAGHVVGRRVIAWGESLLVRIPLVKFIYSATKSIVGLLSSSNRNAFKSVVAVDFPRPGLRAIGFLTQRFLDDRGRPMCAIFIPTTPNPTTGFLEIVPESEVTILRQSVEDGIRIIMSAGMFATDGFGAGVPASSATIPAPGETDGPAPPPDREGAES